MQDLNPLLVRRVESAKTALKLSASRNGIHFRSIRVCVSTRVIDWIPSLVTVLAPFIFSKSLYVKI